jgi:hypothetical protein
MRTSIVPGAQRASAETSCDDFEAAQRAIPVQAFADDGRHSASVYFPVGFQMPEESPAIHEREAAPDLVGDRPKRVYNGLPADIEFTCGADLAAQLPEDAAQAVTLGDRRCGNRRGGDVRCWQIAAPREHVDPAAARLAVQRERSVDRGQAGAQQQDPLAGSPHGEHALEPGRRVPEVLHPGRRSARVRTGRGIAQSQNHLLCIQHGAIAERSRAMAPAASIAMTSVRMCRKLRPLIESWSRNRLPEVLAVDAARHKYLRRRVRPVSGA